MPSRAAEGTALTGSDLSIKIGQFRHAKPPSSTWQHCTPIPPFCPGFEPARHLRFKGGQGAAHSSGVGFERVFEGSSVTLLRDVELGPGTVWEGELEFALNGLRRDRPMCLPPQDTSSAASDCCYHRHDITVTESGVHATQRGRVSSVHQDANVSSCHLAFLVRHPGGERVTVLLNPLSEQTSYRCAVLEHNVELLGTDDSTDRPDGTYMNVDQIEIPLV